MMYIPTLHKKELDLNDQKVMQASTRRDALETEVSHKMA